MNERPTLSKRSLPLRLFVCLAAALVLFLCIPAAAVFLAPPPAVEEPEPEPYGPLPFSKDRDLTEKEIIAIKIRQAARIAGVDPVVAVNVANCESGLKPNVKNAHSSASGLWQFINSTWKSTAKRRGLDWPLSDRFDPVKSTDMALWLVKADGWGHWICHGMLYG